MINIRNGNTIEVSLERLYNSKITGNNKIDHIIKLPIYTLTWVPRSLLNLVTWDSNKVRNILFTSKKDFANSRLAHSQVWFYIHSYIILFQDLSYEALWINWFALLSILLTQKKRIMKIIKLNPLK